jgi:hypothetical protein
MKVVVTKQLRHQRASPVMPVGIHPPILTVDFGWNEVQPYQFSAIGVTDATHTSVVFETLTCVGTDTWDCEHIITQGDECDCRVVKLRIVQTCSSKPNGTSDHWVPSDGFDVNVHGLFAQKTFTPYARRELPVCLFKVEYHFLKR